MGSIPCTAHPALLAAAQQSAKEAFCLPYSNRAIDEEAADILTLTHLEKSCSLQEQLGFHTNAPSEEHSEVELQL